MMKKQQQHRSHTKNHAHKSHHPHHNHQPQHPADEIEKQIHQSTTKSRHLSEETTPPSKHNTPSSQPTSLAKIEPVVSNANELTTVVEAKEITSESSSIGTTIVVGSLAASLLGLTLGGGRKNTAGSRQHDHLTSDKIAKATTSSYESNSTKTATMPSGNAVVSENEVEPSQPASETPNKDETATMPSENTAVSDSITPPAANNDEPHVTIIETLSIMPSPIDNIGETTIASNQTSGKEVGLMLDIAEHFLNIEQIKNYIDMLANCGGSYLHLHLSDDSNYALESVLLNQTVAEAQRNNDGSYTNPITGQSFLSTEQIHTLATYAKQKGIELVPEVDTPAHMSGIINLLQHSKGNEYVQSLFSHNELKLYDSHAIHFAQNLLDEVVNAFGNSSQHIHIGGDEFSYALGDSTYINYVNTLADHFAEQGRTTRIWNDGLLTSNIDSLNRSVQISYWSMDGNPDNSTISEERREVRAGMDDLVNHGFDVLNYNWYYLYFVPNHNTDTSAATHLASDIQSKWTLGTWDGTNHSTALSDTSHVIGAALSIWGDQSNGVSSNKILDWSNNALSALVSKTNSGLNQNLPTTTFTLTNDTPVNDIVSYNNHEAENIIIQASNDVLVHSNTFVWLDGNVGDNAILNNSWAASGASETKNGISYTLYRSGLNHLYLDTDISVSIEHLV